MEHCTKAVALWEQIMEIGQQGCLRGGPEMRNERKERTPKEGKGPKKMSLISNANGDLT